VSRLFFGLTMLAVLAAAFTLAGCGRKGPLDPPPAAAVTGDQAAPKPATGDKTAPLGPDGRPISASEPNKRFFLDGILN